MNTESKKLHQKAITLSRQYRKLEGELVEILQRIDSRRIFLVLGYSSMFDYCRKCLLLGENQAYNFIRVARKALEIPELKRAVIQGEITVSSAKTISAVVTKVNQKEWITKAKSLSRRELEREIVKIKPEEICRDSIRPVADKLSELKDVISDEVRDMIIRVQDLESKRLGKNCTLQEAIRAMGEIYLDKRDPVRKASRARTAQLVPGPVKRKPRAANLHAVNQRDKDTCKAILPNGSSCGSSRWTQVHHIRPFSHGGSHDPSNLVTVCAGHHRAIHTGTRVRFLLPGL